MNIEKLRKITKFKVLVSIISAALPLVIVSILEFLINVFDAPLSVLPDLMAFRYIISVVLEVYLVIKLIKYRKILKNDGFANEYLISKNDERNNYIKLNAHASAVRISFMTLMFSMIIAAFINRYVFYTILGVFTVQMVTYYVVKIIYNRKY
jgi:hypothetical protein